ncbi:cytokine receptor common subunit gamma-like isoform X1 [Takifugu flavidus]|uniref:cytokine receptor common subunit gamma-like isoform X1 n=2 Tax=Takifugu flavidus TaxID=433684 RepID=UPI0025449C9B|nr:cytokine receptor common subunit gamma-like isoform X1 [Takifugu flavidus]
MGEMTTEGISILCSAMSIKLLLLLYLSGGVFTKELPDADCRVMQLETVQCVWNKRGIPEVNYTFHGWFHSERNDTECPTYMSEKNTRVGCIQPYNTRNNRFRSFYTNLQHGSINFFTEHELKNKVKLKPPSNLTVKMGSDSNLWYYWNQSDPSCEENEVRYRINNREWDNSSPHSRSFCINLPSSSSLYELQVRGKLSSKCGESIFWSEWSEPVLWGSNNSTVKTDPHQVSVSMSWWTPLLYLSGALALILMVVMLRHRERVRIILLPVVPKPSFSSYDIQDLLAHSKGLNESFKPSYNEHACPVREYCPASQSD